MFIQKNEDNDIEQMINNIREDMADNVNHRKTTKQNKTAKAKFNPPDADYLRQKFDELVANGINDITIGFWRVSDCQQVSEDSWGPETQMKQITAWAVANTRRGVDIWVHDIESGQHESRVGVDIVREFVKTGKVKRVVGYKYDRVARSCRRND